MIDLEHALTDLAEHLDHPAGDQLADAVRRRLARPARLADRGRFRARALLAAAAVFLVVIASVVAIAPARHAVANWLGIGAIEIRRSDRPVPTTPGSAHEVPGATGSERDNSVASRLAAARKEVQFTIATPRAASAGKLFGVVVDRRVPGGLVALSYERFTLVEIASDPTEPDPIAKVLAPGVRITPVTVNGGPGLWIAGAHQVAYADRTAGFQLDTVRRSGPVLLWVKSAITYRIEGIATLAGAQALAASVR